MVSFFQDIGAYFESLFFYRLPFFPGNIKVSLFIIIFCMVGAVEIYLFVFSRKTKQKLNEKFDKQWKEIISNMLTNIIIFGDEEEGVEKIVKHFVPRFSKLPINKKRVRNVLMDELRVYHSNFTGFTADVLKSLYLNLNLEKYSVQKLKSHLWEVQIEGIREVSQFWLTKYDDIIFKLTDHEHEIVRMEAQTAYVKLNTEDPFKFLDKMRVRILPWHQLILFEVITKTQNVKIPSFSKWLFSDNDSIVIFCLKLINHYQQLDAIGDIVKLLHHPNEEIKKAAVNVIGKLEAEFIENTLLEIYYEESLKIKLEIINAIGRISSGNYMDFLESRLNSDNFEIRMTSMKSILAHGKKGKEKLESLKETVSSENQKIIIHVLDRRI